MNYASILGSSETIRDISHNVFKNRFSKKRFASQTLLYKRDIRKCFSCSSSIERSDDINDNFFDFLAGLIEADGGFYVSKANYCSCEITMHSQEIQTLHVVKAHCGGSVQARTQSKSVRWRLHNRVGMIQLCQNLNGRLHTTGKQIQFQKVWNALGLSTSTLRQNNTTYLLATNAWLSGFFTGDGHFNLNRNNFQASINIGQKDRAILEKISAIWGGNIHYDKSWDGWIWSVSKQHDLKLILAYFNIHSLHNPYKIAKLKGFEKYIRYIERGDHLHHTSKTRLIKYIDWFQREIKVS